MEYLLIKEKRMKYKISQTKLAEKSGYTKAQVSSWELGKSIPTQTVLQNLNLSLEKIIADIKEHVFDIRKKRIVNVGRLKRKLPQIMKDATEYTKKIDERSFMLPNSYRESLSKLYKMAQASKKSGAPKAIALFSGCGGLSLGFAAQGFNLVGHVEIEESANRIYEQNFKGSKLLGTDICKLTDENLKSWINEYGTIDVIIGGPPCQGFSLAGKRDPNDIRNQLYMYYSHIVNIVKPKIFVMENVKLLTSMKTKDGELFIHKILKSFTTAGYNMIKHEINAEDYGVPQSRERVILIGIRKDIKKEFKFPEGNYHKDSQKNLFKSSPKYLTFRDATLDLPLLESGESSNDPLHWSIVHPEHVIKWLRNVPEGCSAHENLDPSLRPPSGFNTTYKRIMWDEPCSTISTNFSMISGCRNVHPVSTRSLTIREAARVQSFPDEFVFIGKWGDVRKAIGNAVPPILAEALAKAIFTQIFMK